MKQVIFYIFSLQLVLCTVQAGFNDYISGIGSYLGLYNGNVDDTEVFYSKQIPYEVSTTDEKFLNEAAKLTGVALSELDSCQHRVVFKLQSDCNKMNDEQLAKMAVHLLNCQSYVEGRQIFPCSDEMSIKDCTTSMDSDTWTSYHLMSNRVRAVCYTIRQSQFRGLAEHTVNRLMDSARDQLRTLGKIANGQEDLKKLSESTYETLNKGHEHLMKQQKDIEMAQFHGQLAIEDNIKRLIDEKRLISDTHQYLIDMTQSMQSKLKYSLQQLNDQSEESKINHKELIEDVYKIEEKVQEVFKSIEHSSTMMMKQNENFKKQYESTIKNLQEVNETVHSLVILVGGTRKLLEERLTWITNALGGTDLAVERLYLILWHSAFMLVAMLACAFLGAKPSSRLVVVSLPPLNLAIALYGEYPYLDPIQLTASIASFILVQTILISAISLMPTSKNAIQWVKEKNIEQVDNSFSKGFTGSSKYDTTNATVEDKGNSIHSKLLSNEDNDDYTNELPSNFKDFHSLTPPLSRNGHYSVKSRSRSNTPLHLSTSIKNSCLAYTRMGTPCKLSCLPGGEFCYRHQRGDSVIS